ncbi:hypothetical protein GLYMA_07G101932v4 [Glycine max]|nr:hypothetical protein GLYMA_07G101932v4 [Glycine max]KAH1086218.1 hypothetical protein GYH30_017953 [Glycine max]
MLKMLLKKLIQNLNLSQDLIQIQRRENYRQISRPKNDYLCLTMILGSIMKMKHYPTVVFLSHWLELKKIQSGLFTLNILLFLPFGSNQLGFLCVIQDPQIGLSAPYHNLLTTLIKGLCPKGQVKKALHFHDKVLAQGFQLNQVITGL